MSSQPMTCTACEREIPRGEKYVAFTRHTEKIGRFGFINVVDAELETAYHVPCAPRKNGR